MKNKKAQFGGMEILLIFVAIILGLAMIGQVFDTQNLVTEKQVVSNKSVDVTSAYLAPTSVNASINFTIYSQSDWKKASCPLTSVALRRNNGTTLTLTTDYLLYANDGVFSIVNTTINQNSNTTYVDYSYCDDGYNTSASSRGVANLWGIFGALIILSAAVFGIRRWIQ